MIQPACPAAALLAALAGAAAPIHTETLASGATIIIEARADSETFGLEILGRAGSLEDGDHQVGLTSLLSSLLLRGGAGSPGTSPAHEVEHTGSSVSRVAGRLGVGLRATGPSEAFEEVFRSLTGAVLRPELSPADLEKERTLHRQTLMTSLDDPSRALDRSVRRWIFGSHDLGRVADPDGYLESVTLDDVRRAHATRFTGRRMIVVMTGGIDPRAAARLARAAFGSLPGGEAPPPLPAGPQALADEKRVRLKRRRAQPSLLIGWPLRPLAPKEEAALDLLASLVAGSHGRLARELREERGWAYWIRDEHWNYPDAGLFAVRTAVPKKRLRDAESIVRRAMEDIAIAGPSDSEVRTARRHLRTRRMRAWQRSGFRAAMLASDALRGRAVLAPEQRMARTESVTTGELRDLAARIIHWSEPAILTLY